MTTKFVPRIICQNIGQRNLLYPSCFSYFPTFSTDNHPKICPTKVYNTYNVWGMLTSIDLKNCDPNSIRSDKHIRNYVKELCNVIHMKRFGKTQLEYFGPTEDVQGYSMFQYIETSSIAGHFANKTNSAYIDIFSCKPYDPKLAASFTAKSFGTNDFTYSILMRK